MVYPPIARPDDHWHAPTWASSRATRVNPDLQAIRDYVYNCPIRLYDVQHGQLIDRSMLIRNISDAIGKVPAHSPPNLFQSVTATNAATARQLQNQIRDLSRYAILSHRWDVEELSFGDMEDREKMIRKVGYKKLAGLCDVASREYQCRYVWLDTLCINSTSSAELEESIQSMYTWYKTAHVCLVYLTTIDSLHSDEWFKRGWTLQELLASRRVKFYYANWKKVEERGLYDIDHVASGSVVDSGPLSRSYFDSPRGEVYSTTHRTTNQARLPIYMSGGGPFLERIALAAGIDKEYLESYYQPTANNANMVYRWVSRRTTTRPEDIAYCLFGLLSVSISIVYGEGKASAFYRLQCACAQATSDRRIFVWRGRPSPWNSMLPDDPQAFRQAEDLSSCELLGYSDNGDQSFSFTNFGLRINVLLYDIVDATIERVNTVAVGSEGLVHDILLWFSGEDTSGSPSTQLTVMMLGPPLEASEVCTWKVALLGESTKGRFAVLLRKNETDGSYVRFATARFFNFKAEPANNVISIFVK